MYRVLLADDEPLVLAGIKTILDWPEENCELIGSARNGRQALDMIGSLEPDIVIADINMPVMDGIDLLKQAHLKYPETVFIMLTNFQEFELVRDSLRYHAVDYLVKTQLEQDNLRDSLAKAKKESDKRRTIGDFLFEKKQQQINESQLLTDSIRLLLVSKTISSEVERLYQNTGVLNCYLLISIQFIYPEYLSAQTFDSQDSGKLYHWEWEVIDELARNCFPHIAVGNLDEYSHQMLILVWGSGNADHFTEQLQNFYKKIVVASSNITRIVPCLLATDVLSGRESLPVCRRQLLALHDYFYLTGTRQVRFSEISEIRYVPLGLTGITGSLQKELNRKHAASCAALFERAISRIEQEPHQKSQALWLCTELYYTICEFFGSNAGSGEPHSMFSDSVAGYARIQLLSTRKDVSWFLRAVSNELQSILQLGVSRHDVLVETVKQYIYENIDKRIVLQEAANRVFLSPGYLSAVFKKHCGESFVDFANHCKVEKACELLKQEEYLIGQVGDMLSFESAYYFSKIFKRYMGMTPSEYRERFKQKQL